MEFIGKVSKGSRMNQVYIPKHRLTPGEYVLISPAIEKPAPSIFTHNAELPDAKKLIIERVFAIIRENSEPENIFINGSFLDKGYGFDDLDIIIIGLKKNSAEIRKRIVEFSDIRPHLIFMDYRELQKSMNHDPVFELSMSRYVSMKRYVTRKKREIHYKFLDLALLKGKEFTNNFEVLNNKEIYKYLRNIIAISLFLDGKALTYPKINKDIEQIFRIKIDGPGNFAGKWKIIAKNYKTLYKNLESRIFDSFKQEKSHQ